MNLKGKDRYENLDRFVSYQDSHEVLGTQSRVPPELGVLVKSESEVAELKYEEHTVSFRDLDLR